MVNRSHESALMCGLGQHCCLLQHRVQHVASDWQQLRIHNRVAAQPCIVAVMYRVCTCILTRSRLATTFARVQRCTAQSWLWLLVHCLRLFCNCDVPAHFMHSFLKTHIIFIYFTELSCQHTQCACTAWGCNSVLCCAVHACHAVCNPTGNLEHSCSN